MGWREAFGSAASGAATGGAVGGPWGAAVGGVGGFLGGFFRSRGADRAQRAHRGAAKAGTRAWAKLLGPYTEAGTEQLPNLSRMANLGPEDIHNMAIMDPSYEFRRQEGMRGLESSAAARGTLLTGGTLRDAIRYNSNFASTEYGNAYNRAATGVNDQFRRGSTVAGMGLNAGTNIAGAVTDLGTGAANADAAASVARGNIWGDTVDSGVNATLGWMAGRRRAGGAGSGRQSSYGEGY